MLSVSITCIHFILFLAVCELLCLNGGICSSPGICTCLAGWTGSACNEGNHVCMDTAWILYNHYCIVTGVVCIAYIYI